MIKKVKLIGGAKDGCEIPVSDILAGDSCPSILVIPSRSPTHHLRYVRLHPIEADDDDISFGFLDYIETQTHGS